MASPMQGRCLVRFKLQMKITTTKGRAFSMGSRRLIIAGFAGLTVLIASTSALAQERDAFRAETIGPAEGEWEMTLGGSGSSDREFEAGGFGVSGSLGYFLTESWELAVRQSFNYADIGAGDAWNASTRGAIDYHFDLNRLRPFIGANFGGLYGKRVNDSWAAGLEAGLKYYVKPKTFIFGMAEYQWLFNDADNIDNNFDEGQLLYTVGIGFNF